MVIKYLKIIHLTSLVLIITNFLAGLKSDITVVSEISFILKILFISTGFVSYSILKTSLGSNYLSASIFGMLITGIFLSLLTSITTIATDKKYCVKEIPVGFMLRCCKYGIYEKKYFIFEQKHKEFNYDTLENNIDSLNVVDYSAILKFKKPLNNGQDTVLVVHF